MCQGDGKQYFGKSSPTEKCICSGEQFAFANQVGVTVAGADSKSLVIHRSDDCETTHFEVPFRMLVDDAHSTA